LSRFTSRGRHGSVFFVRRFRAFTMNRTLLTLLSVLSVLSSGCATKPMVSGYTQASVTDKEVVAAAQFAITAQSNVTQQPDIRQRATLELLRVIAAEKQVVAGMNYRLILSVNENGNRKTANAIVWWQPWRKPNPYELTSWKWK